MKAEVVCRQSQSKLCTHLPVGELRKLLSITHNLGNIDYHINLCDSETRQLGSSSPIEFDTALLLMDPGVSMTYLQAFLLAVQPIRGVGHCQPQGKYILAANAFPGEHGYIKNSTGSFICLGHTSQYTDCDAKPFDIFTWGLPGQGDDV